MRLQLDSTTTAAADTPAADQIQNGSGNRAAGQGTASIRDSSYVSGISSILNNSSTERSTRIQHLANLVQSGTYHVSASDISRAIVTDSLAERP